MMNLSRTLSLTQLKTMSAAAILVSAALGMSACSDKKAEETPAETETVVVDEPAVVEEAPAEAPVEEPAPEAEAPAEADAPAEETAEAPADTANADVVLAADTGEKLYQKQCVACHGAGLLNAPKLGDKEAWAPRIAKGKDTLHEHSAKGFNQMPAQAVNGVSEAEVHAAVDYLIAAAS